MQRNNSPYLVGILFAAGCLLFGPDRQSFGGGLLGFQFDPDGPLILGINGNLHYDVSTGEFSGKLLPLTLSSSTLPGDAGFVRFSGDPQLDFDLFVNRDGTFQRNGAGFDLTGTLSIGGTNISGTLLTGDFTAFGAEPAGTPTWVANALSDTTGGLLTESRPLANGTSLPAQFPVGGPSVGADFFVENETTGTLGDFGQSFGSDRIKIDIGLTSIPEPASWVPGVIAIAILSALVFIKERGMPIC